MNYRWRWILFLHRCRTRYPYRFRLWLKRTFICKLRGHDWHPDGSWGWSGKTCNRCWLTVVERRATWRPSS